MTATLTDLEQKVFDALMENAQDVSGGDFAILEEVKPAKLGLTAQQFGGLITTLQGKRRIYLDKVRPNGGRVVTQVSLYDENGDHIEG